MRAIFIADSDLIHKKEITVVGDTAFHLIKVIRLTLSEKILVLNGQGIKATAVVSFIDKKSVLLQIGQVEHTLPGLHIDLAFGMPKKETLESFLKDSAELGIHQLFPLKTEYSQPLLQVKEERVQSLLESALIQANNPYLPKLTNPISLKLMVEGGVLSEYLQIFLFSLRYFVNREESFNYSFVPGGKYLIILGPEGGLSEKEEDLLIKLPNITPIRLDLPILRASTALPVATGFVHGLLQRQ